MNANPTNHERSAFRLAATTPLRDWVRLRLTGRLDWRAPITRAELPEPLASLVTRVVGRSRLWKLEKADLAQELCVHFTDGLASGTTAEQLVDDFGNDGKATKLIRRAKKRGRHWTHHAFVHTCRGIAAVFLAGVLAYALLAWRFYTGEPTIARNYTAEYNATIEEIREDDRAWPLYMETYASFDKHPVTLLSGWPAIAPEHPSYTEAVEFLSTQQDVLTLVHHAADRPRLGAFFSDAIDNRLIDADNARDPEAHLEYGTPSENPMLISILLPELGHMRALARLVTFDAHVAAAAGESDRVARDISSMLVLAEHAADRPVLISSLVALAIESLAINTTADIINEYPDLFTDDQLRDLAHRHAAFMGGNPHVVLTGERWFFEDIVQRVYTDDGDGNGHITAQGLRDLMKIGDPTSDSLSQIGPKPFGPITAALIANRADMTAKHDEFMTQMERNADLPMWEYESRGSADTQIELLNTDPIQRVRFMPIVLLMPAIDKASHVAEIATQRRDGLLTGIALELYKRDLGNYPDTLDALVPSYLPGVPPDRFTGSQLRYALVDGSPRLWSVGTDRNDDDGVPPADSLSGYNYDETRWTPESQARHNEQGDPDRYDGDWVLWPIIYKPITGEDED